MVPSLRAKSCTRILPTGIPPVKLISMLCVRADPEGGGRSLVLDIETLRDEVRSRLGDRTLELLATEPVPWLLAPYRGGGVSWRAVLSETSVCWRRYTIEMAVASLGIEFSPSMNAALDSLDEIVMDTPGTLEFLMREGEWLFVDNHKTLHARTPLANPLVSDRLMIRSWVAPCCADRGGWLSTRPGCTHMALRFHWMLPKGGEVGMKSAQATSRVLTTERSSPCGRPDTEGWLRFARCAEEAGIESVLLSFSRYEPDTLMIACALGRATTTLKFIVAYRSGLLQPTTFVQQLNTLSGLIGGRVAVNIVAGSSSAEQRGYGDFLEHDERYARTEEFLAICHAFWRRQDEVDFHGKYFRVERGRLHTPYTAPERSAPEIYVSGHSPQAEQSGTFPGLVLVAPDRHPGSTGAPGGADP